MYIYQQFADSIKTDGVYDYVRYHRCYIDVYLATFFSCCRLKSNITIVKFIVENVCDLNIFIVKFICGKLCAGMLGLCENMSERKMNRTCKSGSGF